VAGTLAGQTLGVAGLGSVGAEVVRKGRAFDMHVYGLSRTGARANLVARHFTPDRWLDFVAELDVLVLTLPRTPQTEGAVDARVLDAMKPGALLVNVGRGLIVDEAALIAALESGRLGGAALDVFPIEPLPADSPLWRMPGVFVSPHCADASPQSLDRGFLILLDNLERFARGRPLRNVVDRQQGY
jgi:glyoxylate/hydroxypyruvate reductase A